MPLDDAVHHRQAKPRPLPLALGGEKRIENLVHDLLRNTRAVVCNGQLQVIAAREIKFFGLLLRHADRHEPNVQPAPLAAQGMKGVGAQIHDYLMNLGRIGQTGGQSGCNDIPDFDVPWQRCLDQRHGLPHHLGHIGRLEPLLRGTAEGQNLLDQPTAPLRRLEHPLQVLSGEGVCVNVLQSQFRGVHDGG